MNTWLFSARGGLCALIVAVVLVGCNSEPGNPPTYPVTGKVTRSGVPLVNASIVLIPENLETGTAAMANSDDDGNFELTTFVAKDGARPGTYKVKLSQYDKPVETPEKLVVNLTYEEEQALYQGEGPPVPMPKNLLPKKFENPNTSGITHTVPEGPSTLNIEIK